MRGMNAKKVNWMYIVMFLCYIAMLIGLNVYVRHHGYISVYPLYLINELVYLLPAVVFVVVSRDNIKELLSIKKIKISTALMVVLFTFLCLPLTTVINVFTMFFVDNTVAASSGTILQMPFVAAFFLIAVYAPVCEEVIFRGITYESLKKDVSVFRAMCLSAVFFGLAHMNLNQAAYAIALGVILVLLKEATGSLLATMLFHIVFNGYSVVLMYVEKWASGGKVNLDISSTFTRTEYRDYLLQSLGVFIIIAAVTTALAGCVLAWIAGNEGRKEQLRSVWAKRRENKGRILRFSLVIALVLYIGVMIADVIM